MSTEELVRILVQHQQEQLKRQDEESQRQQQERRNTVIQETKVKPYDGNEDPRVLNDFVREIKSRTKRYHLCDAELIEVAGKNMTGKAKSWYRRYEEALETEEDSETKGENQETFDKLVAKLKDNFTKTFDQDRANDKFVKLLQTGSVADFNHEFSSLLGQFLKSSLEEEDKVYYYRSKLKHYIKAEVTAKRPQTLQEAMQLALIYEGHNNINANSDYRRKDKSKFGKNDQTKPKKQNGQLCFNCEGTNHKAEHCTAPPSKKLVHLKKETGFGAAKGLVNSKCNQPRSSHFKLRDDMQEDMIKKIKEINLSSRLSENKGSLSESIRKTLKVSEVVGRPCHKFEQNP